MKKLAFILLLLSFVGTGFALTPKDSVQIVTANWSPQKIQPGITHKHAPFKFLFGVPQNIHIVEVVPGRRNNRIHLMVNEPEQETSESARSMQAVAAINGSYFNMERGHSVCFLKIGPEIIANTAYPELENRITGAVRIDKKGRFSVIPWSRSIEEAWDNDDDIVMASGPLLVSEGEECSFPEQDNAFTQKRHPRSAVGVTDTGAVLLVTVDGRSMVHAAGMTIPELAFLMRLLGCRQALNLDGGGSTTLWLDKMEGSGVVNMPCDNSSFDHDGERKVANILYVK